jgi:hypothetical protein
MAEPNSITSATNGDHHKTAPSVSPHALSGLGLSRRQVMKTISAVAAVPAVSFADAAHALSSQPNRADWDTAFAEYEHAARDADFHSTRYNAIEKAYFAACERVPDVTLRPDPHAGISEPLTTSRPSHVAHARRSLEGLVEWGQDATAHVALCRELVAADDARKAQMAEIDASLGYSKTVKAFETAVDRHSEKARRLLTMPAPDGEALLWKLDYLYFSQFSWAEEINDQTAGDARRLLLITH